MKMKKGEIWIASTIFLFVIVIILVGINYELSFTTYDVNGFEFPKKHLPTFIDVVKENNIEQFEICSTEEDRCITGALLPEQ